MREKSRDKERLQHIIEAIERILNYTKGCDYDMFVSNSMMFYAVLMNISIIGEAANMLTEDFRNSHPDKPWKLVRGMRNYLVHDYCNVDDIVVWDVVTNDLPILKNQIEQYLQEFSEEF